MFFLSLKASKNLFFLLLLPTIFFGCKHSTEADLQMNVDGLQDSVEVIRDANGINHIYANNQHDLFFAQGYCAAKDRLFQFEIWRRQATGTVAEILGERELQRDIGTRLFKFRGDMDTEMAYYHPDGIEIITAYTNGVNAYIEEALQNPEELPVTFKALDILPQKWSPEVVISRHQGLLGNITEELDIGRAVAEIGAEKVNKYMWFHPKEPILELDADIDGALLSQDILALYNAYRSPVQFQPSDIVPEYRTEKATPETAQIAPPESEKLWIGSNNWVTAPQLSKNGHAYMANDPHRRLAAPSLRYWVHLSAPGWNVIGGGEPEIPGVSIGHNEYGAWGLTVFRTDGEDLYVYDLNPDNLEEYKYEDSWEKMESLQETIAIKNKQDTTVTLRYTHHGPVTHIDSVNHKAYAVKCAWMEPGGAPYLASLRMDQAKNWEEFREACNYSHIPGENMVWADKNGNIGWQAVGIAPIRKNFSGLVPVPGDGRYEWDGYLPIVEKPHLYNPEKGYIATANENVTPEEYDRWDAIGYSWSDPYRGMRIASKMESGKPLDMEAMKQLQTDYHSMAAQLLVPQLQQLTPKDSTVAKAIAILGDWDYKLNEDSNAAAVYVAWEAALEDRFFDYFPDPEAEKVIDYLQMGKLIPWIMDKNSEVGKNAETYLLGTLASAIKELSAQYGDDMTAWKYGGENYKHVQIKHPLGDVVNADLRARLNTELKPRGGNQHTPNATGGAHSQLYGASFRFIVDVNDWDASVGANAPGQSGDPESPYYNNLYDQWADNDYFRVYFSKDSIKAQQQEVLRLMPSE